MWFLKCCITKGIRGNSIWKNIFKIFIHFVQYFCGKFKFFQHDSIAQKPWPNSLKNLPESLNKILKKVINSFGKKTNMSWNIMVYLVLFTIHKQLSKRLHTWNFSTLLIVFWLNGTFISHFRQVKSNTGIWNGNYKYPSSRKWCSNLKKENWNSKPPQPLPTLIFPTQKKKSFLIKLTFSRAEKSFNMTSEWEKQ